MKVKENEELDKHLDLAREQQKSIEHEGNHSWSPKNKVKESEMETGGNGKSKKY